MKRITWSDDALSDLARLREFLQPKNPDAARRAIKAIRDGVKLLIRNSEIGRPVRGLPPEFRERLIRFGAGVYVARYRVDGDAVVILAVRHSREAGLPSQ